MLFKGLCSLDLKPRGAANWSNCDQIHALRTNNWQKSLNCPECAQLSLVYCSVYETCVERFLLHYSVALCSPYTPGRKKTKNTLNMTFSVYFPYLVLTSPSKICMCVSQLYPKLRIMHKKGHFHDPPVQLVQTLHRFASCAIGQVMLHL